MKFFRNLVGLQDEFYNQQMMQEHLFEPILNVVYETMPRDNLLNSACLELFDFIRRENVKALVNHLVENYRDKLKDIVYVDTFSSLIVKYDQMQGFSNNLEASFIDTEEDTPGRSQTNSGRRWQGMKDLDAAEEEYFNTSDEEEENSAKSASVRAAINGASPSSTPLVDYPSDEEGEMMDTEAAAALPKKADSIESTKTDEEDAFVTLSPASVPPPERLSEKRRREEDEEDELGKLSLQQHKRRSSTSSVSSAGSVSSSSSNVLRKKKSFTNSKETGVVPTRKMHISISPAIKSGGESKQSGEDGS